MKILVESGRNLLEAIRVHLGEKEIKFNLKLVCQAVVLSTYAGALEIVY